MVTPLRFCAMLRKPFDKVPWSEVLGDDCHLRIANDPPAVGKEQTIEGLSDFCRRIDGFGLFADLWRSREAIFAETEVLMPSSAGTRRVLPCTIIARTDAGLLRDLRFHLDMTPLA